MAALFKDNHLGKVRRSVRDGFCYLASKAVVGSSVGSGRPIFIVGTGRCGTTLLVRILESHPEILVFPSEANTLWHPSLYPFNQSRREGPPIEVDPIRFTQSSLESWPADHQVKIGHVFRGYQVLKGTRDVFVVKSAMISFMIPKILEIYPKAKILHIFRAGPPVVESYLKKNLQAYPDGVFAEEEYRLLCARYWNACILEIERVRTALQLSEKGAFSEFSYESLCENPAVVVQELADFLGVDPRSFAFNFSTIDSKNYKVGSWMEDNKWKQALVAMQPGMKLKGYTPV